MANLQLLEKLCNARGISGKEDNVRDIILEEIKGYADECTIDNMGNIIVFKKGKAPAKNKLMLSAHMDEVGFIVTYITDEGLLKFSCVGGIDKRVISGKSVTVGKNAINGVIGLKPIHLLNSDGRAKTVDVEDLYIDIGANSKEDALQHVSLGDMVCFKSVFDTSNGMIRAKAIDDRAGCLILIEMIKSELPYDMYFTFVVQEEVGLCGSKVAAYIVEPNASIVVEATTAADIPNVDSDKKVCFVNKGAVISFMDRRTIYDKDLYNMAIEMENTQPKQAVAGGNDAGAIHTSKGGVKTLAVSLPCRYLHSPTSVISQSDLIFVENTVRACAEKIAGGLGL